MKKSSTPHMLNPIRAIVVDDEKQAREGIQLLLKKVPSIELVALCKNGIEAIESIRTHRPNLLFLDIQMPEINGFEVLNSLEKRQIPAIIFTTAYDQFALKAFELHAIDYLLKPFTDERFFESIEHAKTIIDNAIRSHHPPDVSSLLSHYFHGKRSSENAYIIQDYFAGQITHSNRLAIKSNGKIHFISLKDIRYLEGYDSYIKIHTSEKMFVVKDSLKAMEQKLPEQTFIRIQKSYIVNIEYVKTLEPYFNGDFYVVLSSGERLKGSRKYRKQLEHRYL